MTTIIHSYNTYNKWCAKKLNKDKKIGFICASGARSKIVLDFLLEQGIKNIYHIPEGITGRSSEGWLFQGYPITNFSTKKD